jgi:hypothetical protein
VGPGVSGLKIILFGGSASAICWPLSGFLLESIGHDENSLAWL